MDKVVILGGGMSGLCTLNRLKDIYPTTLITLPNLGSVAPFMHIRSMPRNKALLRSLGITDLEAGRWQLGYSYKERVYRKATPRMFSEYMEKCYGSSNPDNVPFYETDYMYYTTSFATVLKLAEERLRSNIIYDKVTKIDLQRKTITTQQRVYGYTLLINTIALPDFLRMSLGLVGSHFSARPLYIYESEHDMEDFGTIHVMDKMTPTTRYHKECGGPHSYEERLTPYQSDTVQPIAFFKYGKIMLNPTVTAYRNLCLSFLEQLSVTCIGRYSKWTQHADIEDASADLEKFLQTRQDLRVMN